MNLSYLTELLEAVKEVSSRAGFAILEVYQMEDIGLSHKSDKSPLTLADRLSNDVITEALKILTPDIPIISEEDLNANFDERKNYTYCWIVDPLDGTKEFVKRNDEFTTNIALCHQGNIILGVVYAPVFDEMYWAIKENGAYKKKGDTIVSKLTCKTFDIKSKKLRIICSRSHINEPTQAYVDALDDPIIIRKGSSLKMMQIAEGEADVYPRLGPTMEWDTAASQIIVEEAGGSLIDYKTEKTLLYNKEDLYNPHFLALGANSNN